jgi:ACR3 family arsenite efflux pump ArsB
VTWLERNQVACYLLALAVGAGVGLAVPALRGPAAATTTPVLAVLLYVTFLGIPLVGGRRGSPDPRFALALVGLNAVAAPLVAFGLTRLVAFDASLEIGALLVLLAPCIDYVVVFAGLAGGASRRLLAAPPLLMLGQVLLVPVYLRLFAGAEVADAIEIGPFLEAFVWLVVVPFASAWLAQVVARRSRRARRFAGAAGTAMVPVMMATLAVVVCSQIGAVVGRAHEVAWLVPVYVLFAGAMTAIGVAASRVLRLEAPEGRAATFSGVTRNSLVVLPLALALPGDHGLATVAVVAQTLVELIVMVVLVAAVPRLVPLRRRGSRSAR